MITRERAYELRALIEQAAALLSDDVAFGAVELFPKWNGSGHEYESGDRVSYNGRLYKCISESSHTSQSSWNPADAHSLWMIIDDPNEEWPAWEQRTGLEAYRIGAKVSHNDKHWISTLDYNAYEPGVYGWDEVS